MQAIIAINAIDTQRVDVVRCPLLYAYHEYIVMAYRITSFTNG